MVIDPHLVEKASSEMLKLLKEQYIQWMSHKWGFAQFLQTKTMGG